MSENTNLQIQSLLQKLSTFDNSHKITAKALFEVINDRMNAVIEMCDDLDGIDNVVDHLYTTQAILEINILSVMLRRDL